MLFLGFVHHAANAYLAAVIDVVSLVLLTTPPIYIWVIKPFVTAHDEALAQISHLAHIDPLTQLANRRLLSNHFQKAIASINRYKIYGALLLLDLDGFKPINDVHGHDAGDAVLVEIANRLQSMMRSDDVVGRLGGDEFVVLVNHLDVDEGAAHDKALHIANKLILLVTMPLEFNGKTLSVAASIGIRLLSFEELKIEKALSEADIALYRAKQAGKGCAVFFKK